MRPLARAGDALRRFLATGVTCVGEIDRRTKATYDSRRRSHRPRDHPERSRARRGSHAPNGDDYCPLTSIGNRRRDNAGHLDVHPHPHTSHTPSPHPPRTAAHASCCGSFGNSGCAARRCSCSASSRCPPRPTGSSAACHGHSAASPTAGSALHQPTAPAWPSGPLLPLKPAPCSSQRTCGTTRPSLPGPAPG
jgi:hypothetical protein